MLSLFDGMSCAMISLIKAGIGVKAYNAYEIDEYAIQTSKHNFPNIQHHGNVYNDDFFQYKNTDLLIAGSPCTYWSSSKKTNRETIPEGKGWDLYSQFRRAISEALPKFFIYENTGSMSNKVKIGISSDLGVAPISINSSLFSAQSRQRDYWVGEKLSDDTYKTVKLTLPPSSRLVCSDILENAWDGKVIKMYPINTKFNGKSHVIKAQYQNTSLANILCDGSDYQATGVAEEVFAFELPKLFNSKTQQKTIYATPTKFEGGNPVRAISPTDGKEYDVYKVNNGKIYFDLNTKECDLPDGFYLIRKLTLVECKRLQNIPEYYKFPVSEKQAYKLIGNGFTCDVIAWIIKNLKFN